MNGNVQDKFFIGWFDLILSGKRRAVYSVRNIYYQTNVPEQPEWAHCTQLIIKELAKKEYLPHGGVSLSDRLYDREATSLEIRKAKEGKLEVQSGGKNEKEHNRS